MDMSIKKLLTLLQSEYPSSFTGMDARTMRLKTELWEREFAKDDINLVYAAIRAYMESPERFAPSIGQVREKMRLLTQKESLSEQAAWALVSRACRNGLYGYQKEFDKLPAEVQRAVGVPEQLRAWAAMDADTLESVVASNFMRSYRAQTAKDKEIAMLPQEVRQMLGGISEGMKLIGD